jgi:hypothetical protein
MKKKEKEKEKEKLKEDKEKAKEEKRKAKEEKQRKAKEEKIQKEKKRKEITDDVVENPLAKKIGSDSTRSRRKTDIMKSPSMEDVKEETDPQEPVEKKPIPIPEKSLSPSPQKQLSPSPPKRIDPQKPIEIADDPLSRITKTIGEADMLTYEKALEIDRFLSGSYQIDDKVVEIQLTDRTTENRQEMTFIILDYKNCKWKKVKKSRMLPASS